MIREDKQRLVESMKAEFARARNAFLMGFQGLNVAQVTDLRRRVRSTSSSMRVIKNRLAARAAADTPLASLGPHIRGPLALVYNEGEPVPLARALLEFARDNPQLEFRAGVAETRAIDAAGFQMLATLPAREALVARLLGLLSSPQRRLAAVLSGPLRGLNAVLKQVAERKGAQAG